MAGAQKAVAEFRRTWALLERGDAFFSELFTIARHLVRLRAELPKPSAERLREYRDSNLESLKFQLSSPAPIHSDLERAKRMASLTFLAENLGGEHPIVAAILVGKSPANRAAELVAGTKLADVVQRKRLFEDPNALDDSNDPMSRLAREVDPAARDLRKHYETELEEVERQGFAAIARRRFAKFGRGVATDATFQRRPASAV